MTTPNSEDWRPAGVASRHIWLTLLADKVSEREGWTGVEDWGDPHLPARLAFTDPEVTIEVTIRPAALYEPTP